MPERSEVGTKFFAAGSAVKVNGNVGRVVTITLREGFVGYQVAWWTKAGDRKFENLTPCEIEAVQESKYAIMTSV